jgi:hypothetical protein
MAIQKHVHQLMFSSIIIMCVLFNIGLKLDTFQHYI